ncbi:Uncharacterized protein PECH_003990 [Penicillium ucsense]|uniref:NAD(P)-binding domain-containing protein n=1 Tax=Penicillium ucsense TaxID=2839758 RepID=A0A8J8W340_9EURO|nr:Uncharacterized protein PECM_004671 [Penicillium ucsense]KAF7737296.1 Uncharacterized protein PECH_003990 [Penicillium ucsense]
MPLYAKDQPAGFTNAMERIAIVGAGGTVGSHIVTSLLQTGRHTVTALSRPDSTNKPPPGIRVVTVDYDNEDNLVTALRGQQFLIITLSPTAAQGTHSKLVRAAAKAGVPYIMPNGYGGDIEQVKQGKESMLGPIAKAHRDEIEALGMHWITVCCGFWYDYSLAGEELRFGFDFARKALTLYDDGNTKNTVSTLSQVGRAVAKLLSLKELPVDENDKSLTLSHWLNKGLYVTSFTISQREMFESVKRVTGTTDDDWNVTHEPSQKRYEDGLALLKTGNRLGFAKLLYARGFFPDDPSQFPEKSENKLLGLPEEDLDKATQVGIDMVPTRALEQQAARS